MRTSNLILAIVGAILFTLFLFIKFSPASKSTSPSLSLRNIVSVDAYVERRRKHVCSDDFKVMSFGMVEASNLNQLAKLTAEKLKTDIKLDESAEVKYVFKNGSYRTVYRHSFEEHLEPTAAYLQYMYEEPLLERGYTKEEVNEIVRKIMDMRKKYLKHFTLGRIPVND